MSRTTLLTRLGVLAAASIAVVATTVSPASAATSVSQTTGLVDQQTITVTGSGLTPSTPVKVGVCSVQTYAGIPACAEGEDVTTNASGAFSLSYVVTQTNANVHKTALPFPLNVPQPDAFTCNGSGGVDCRLLITEHPTGGTKTDVGSYAISFS